MLNGMSSITTEAGSNGHTGALFEGLDIPADSAAALKRSMPRGAPRVQSAVRNQVELRACDLDASLPADHQARAVWAFVQSRDLRTPVSTCPSSIWMPAGAPRICAWAMTLLEGTC